MLSPFVAIVLCGTVIDNLSMLQPINRIHPADNFHIVADDDHRPILTPDLQIGHQGLDHGQIEVIGWLIECPRSIPSTR